MKQTKQLKYWQGQFGEAYIKRNSDLTFFEKRKDFFSSLLKKHSDIKSILEVGCSIGGNLYILQNVNQALVLTGIEPNITASIIAKKLIPKVKIINASIFDSKIKSKFDLVFTSGVLIHIANKDIKHALQKIHTASRKYLLTIEYFAERRQSIPYRDLTDALFKRPFDKEWLAVDPKLQLVNSGFLDKSQGFDNCHWWLYQKV